MRSLFAALALAVAASACQKGNGGGEAADTARFSADTNVTQRTVEDTTIITHDTTVRSDTITKRGGVVDTGAAARRDTGRRRP